MFAMDLVRVAAPRGTRADRIAALRHLVRSTTPTQAARLQSSAEQFALEQSAASSALEEFLGVDNHSVGFVRDTSPRACREHARVVRDARIIGRFPWGAERSVIRASTAILFEDEADALGDRVRHWLLRPLTHVLGPEDTWVDTAAHTGIPQR